MWPSYPDAAVAYPGEKTAPYASHTKLRTKKYQMNVFQKRGGWGDMRPPHPSASRSVEIDVALQRRPLARGGVPPSISRLRQARAHLRARRNPDGVRGIFKVRKLSPAQFGLFGAL